MKDKSQDIISILLGEYKKDRVDDDGEDEVKMWKEPSSLDTLPPSWIPCPLTNDNGLLDTFSITSMEKKHPSQETKVYTTQARKLKSIFEGGFPINVIPPNLKPLKPFKINNDPSTIETK